MAAATAVIFDLAGTLVEWPEEGVGARWAAAHEHALAASPRHVWPDRAAFVDAMSAAEGAHWARVVATQGSAPPTRLVAEGLHRLGRAPDPAVLRAVLDGYARAVEGWSIVCPDAAPTLDLLRERGYRLGLLSNTWWAAAWHDAELATHGLADRLDAIVYTSDLPHSKPHPAVFWEVARLLGVDPAACVMVGDRLVDDVAGALGTGLRAVWKRNERPWPRPAGVVPSAALDALSELPALLRRWGDA